MNKNIFRESAIKKFSSPEELDKIVSVTGFKEKLFIFSIVLMTISFLAWAIFGTIPIEISGKGILISSGGIKNIAPLNKGEILDIKVTENDIVKSGDVVARIERHDLINSINQKKKDLEEFSFAEESNLTMANVFQDIKDLQTEYVYSSFVVSSFEGKVLEVKKDIGEIIDSGESIMSIELSGDNIKKLESIIYVSAEEGKAIFPGMDVHISPTYVNKEEHGYMLGRVVSVSEFPATFDGMLRVLGSEELTKELSDGNSVLEITVDLIKDENTYSGYKWTSSDGPMLKINSGSLCDSKISVENISPLKLFLR